MMKTKKTVKNETKKNFIVSNVEDDDEKKNYRVEV